VTVIIDAEAAGLAPNDPDAAESNSRVFTGLCRQIEAGHWGRYVSLEIPLGVIHIKAAGEQEAE
jgi:hypothetical protein